VCELYLPSLTKGNEDRNNDIWVQMSHRKLRHGAEGVPQICLLGPDTLLFSTPSQEFTCDRIVVSEIPILDVLLRQLGLLWYLVSMRMFSSTILGGEM
jgi:hypothetical protein